MTTLVAAARPRRPRRIAADEAHAWARNLRLGNPYAKLILSMLTIYVNGEGSCFVSIAELAEDCELAVETVRRRLGWLEQVGAIARFPQWIDAAGRRNGEGRGKRTTDDVRLLINTDPDEIEARAKGGTVDDDSPTAETEVSPLREGGVNRDEDSISPPVSPLAAPSLQTGTESFEPEPEIDSPNPPSGGGRGTKLSQESEERLLRFIGSYPSAITDYPKARAIWAALTDTEQDDAITGAKGYAGFIGECSRKGRSRNVKDAHRWLRDRMWMGYLKQGQQALSAARRFTAAQNSAQWLAWDVYYRCCGMHGIPEHLRGAGSANLPSEWPPDVGPASENWRLVAEGTGQYAAWMRRLRELPNANIATRSALVDGRMRPTLTVPSEWPPAKHPAAKDSTGPPTTPLATDQDAEDFVRMG